MVIVFVQEKKEIQKKEKNTGNEVAREGSFLNSSSRFTKPLEAEVRSYALSVGFAELSAAEFIAFYESKGWVVGRSPMKDWRAAVRTWKIKYERERPQKALKAERSPDKCPQCNYG